MRWASLLSALLAILVAVAPAPLAPPIGSASC